MTASDDKDAKEDRDRRLAEALRQNLRRRKARQRGEDGKPADAPGSVAERDC